MRILEDDLKIQDKHAGIGALNPMGVQMAASRGNMGNTQLSKTVAVEGLEPPIILTGHEQSMIHALKQGKIEGSIVVLKRLDKVINGHRVSSFIFFYNEEDEIDIIEIPKFETLDNKMLFEHKNTDIMDNLEPGDELDDPILTTTPSNVDGYNAFGVPLEVVFANINEVGEDAIIISESAAEKFSFWMTKEVVINKSKYEHFKNIYGNDAVWKGFPDIGEEVREDGIIYDMFSLSTDMNYHSLDNLRTDYVKEPTPIDNNVSYGKGIVYDINVITQPRVKHREAMLGVNDQVEFYKEELIKHKKELIRTYEDICKNEGMGIFDTSLRFSPELSLLISDAFTYDIEGMGAKYGLKNGTLPIRRMLFKNKLNDTLITIKMRYKVVPGKGYKLSDMHGAKGIIAMVLPDEDMPCECILNPLAVSDRTIPSRLAETYLAGVTRVVRKEALAKLDESYSEANVDNAINYIVGYYNIVTPKLGSVLNSYNHKDRLEFMTDLKDSELHINKRFEDADFIKLYEEIEASPYAKVYIEGVIKIPNVKPIDITGKTSRGILYTTLLNNLPTSSMATDKPRINSLGLSPSTSKEVKNKYPYNMQATKILSEPETKIITSYCTPFLIAELRDRMSSTERQLAQCVALLKEKDPANIPVLLDRKKYPFIAGIGTEIMNAIYVTGGFKLTHTKLER